MHSLRKALFLICATVAALVSTFAVFRIRTRKHRKPDSVRWSDSEGTVVFLGFWFFFMLCVMNQMAN